MSVIIGISTYAGRIVRWNRWRGWLPPQNAFYDLRTSSAAQGHIQVVLQLKELKSEVRLVQ
jgi:hypothetical protein